MVDYKQQLDEGRRAFEQEKYEEAFSLLLPCAEAGFLDAEAAIGLLYMLGMGVPRDLYQAIELLERAAEKGSGVAAHNLGTLYLTCEPDLPVDQGESKRWYQRASDLGFKPGAH